MVSHSWIQKTLELVGPAANIIELLKRSIQSWGRALFSGKLVYITGYISRRLSVTLVICCCSDSCYNNPYNTETGIRKGKERLNHLLFMDYLKLYGINDIEIDSLVKVVKIMSGIIGM